MKDNGSICLYPWLHFQISPDNYIMPCCKWDNGHNVEESKASIENFREEFKPIRERMLAGEKLKECTHCYSLENAKSLSMRNTINRDYNLISRELTSDYLDIEDIEIGLDNICNYQCRMCSSRFSSSLAKRDSILKINFPGMFRSSKQELTKNRLEKIKSLDVNWSKLKRVKIIGGEPLISPSLEPFIDFLLEVANPSECVVSITTNCSQKISNELYDKLNQFKYIVIMASFDSIGKWNDYQRVGSNFKRDIDNYFHYISKLKNPETNVNSVFTVHNLNSFNEFDEWWNKNCPKVHVSVDVVQFHAFSPHYMPEWYTKWIDSKIDYSTLRGSDIQSILFDKRKFDPKYSDQFYLQTMAYDIFHGTDIEEVNPELMNLVRRYM